MYFIRFAFLFLIASASTLPAYASEKAWVASERLNRRTCPASNCGIVGQYFYREGVQIIEERNGWARVTKYYDASCNNGKSEYVDTGNASCSVSNGIKNGKFAEWISLKHIARKRPADPSAGAVGTAKLIRMSDDFQKYKTVFVKATNDLLASKRCTKNDFKNMGGWFKSTTTYRSKPVYFTYCGKMTLANRIYLNASTGRVFQ